MGVETKIQWCHATFNPWMGCSKVHSGCKNCYAMTALPVAMYPGGKLRWGEVWQGGQRVVKSEAGWREPLAWARESARKGERRRVFCASLADVLEVPAFPPFEVLSTETRDAVNAARHMLDAARARLWDLIRATSRVCVQCKKPTSGIGHPHPAGNAGLDWLILTKRPENWQLIPPDVRKHVWLGTSVSDQETADEWTPRLLQAQGFRHRFLSVEPMTGPVDMTRFLKPTLHTNGGEQLQHPDPRIPSEGGRWEWGVSWVIAGFESGKKSAARSGDLAWVRSLMKQCSDAGVAFHLKQLGARPYESAPILGGGYGQRGLTASMGDLTKIPEGWTQVVMKGEAKLMRYHKLNHPKGGDMSEWPEDLRVREIPRGRADD